MPSQCDTPAKNVLEILRAFLADERGQDMIEYTLLVAFIALASAAIYISAGKQVHGVWSQANSTLVLANSAGS